MDNLNTPLLYFFAILLSMIMANIGKDIQKIDRDQMSKSIGRILNALFIEHQLIAGYFKLVSGILLIVTFLQIKTIMSQFELNVALTAYIAFKLIFNSLVILVCWKFHFILKNAINVYEKIEGILFQK